MSKDYSLGPCKILDVYPSLFLNDLKIAIKESHCEFNFRFEDQSDIIKFYSLMNKNELFVGIKIQSLLYARNDFLKIHRFIITKLKKKKKEVIAKALPSKNKRGLYWEIQKETSP